MKPAARHYQYNGHRAWAINAAVGPKNGWATFYSAHNPDKEDWGYHTNGPEANPNVFAESVQMVSLSEFMSEFLLPEHTTLVKMDIGHSEHALLDDLCAKNVVGLIDVITIEVHKPVNGMVVQADLGESIFLSSPPRRWCT